MITRGTFRTLASVLVLAACGTAACRTTSGPSKALDAGAATASTDQASGHAAQYSRYLKDTITSLEMMRGRTGLIMDSVWVCQDQVLGRGTFHNAPDELRPTETLTSPTNIGLDIILLTQRALAPDAVDSAAARATLTKLFALLGSDAMAYHTANGLFFRTYEPATALPSDINLSSVDNLHLAYGFWVAARSLGTLEPTVAATAQRLFDRMDFSDYYNTDTGLIGGNMRPVGEDPAKHIKGDPQGDYKRDLFDYKYFGSEARSLYALGWALGLFRRAGRDIPDFDQKILGPAITGTIAEIVTEPTPDGGTLRLLRTWDGGGFQALLPAVLVREDLYSPILGDLHKNYARRLLNDAAVMGVPAAHSASAFGVLGLRIFRSNDPDYDKNLPIYNGAAGHVDMVATIHTDVKDPAVRMYWDIAYTPHPAFMAASFARDADMASSFASVFLANETLASSTPCVCGPPAAAAPPAGPAASCLCGSTDDLPNQVPGPDGINGEPNLCAVSPTPLAAAKDHLYEPGLGWMDGYYTSGPFKGRVVPVLISLDQSMIALSLFSMLSPDGHHVGSRAVAADATVSGRLRQAYQAINDKLAALP